MASLQAAPALLCTSPKRCASFARPARQRARNVRNRPYTWNNRHGLRKSETVSDKTDSARQPAENREAGQDFLAGFVGGLGVHVGFRADGPGRRGNLRNIANDLSLLQQLA